LGRAAFRALERLTVVASINYSEASAGTPHL
jgi:hypothetical protein